MERVAVAVESARHPPALYWGVVSAAALCSLYGTFALAKRNSNNQVRNGSGVTAGVAFKKLRRKYAEKLRPVFEDLVYLTMFIINLVVGVFYWVIDLFLESRASPPKLLDLSRRPRRGEIKRLRARWAWARGKSKPRQRCDCWGWRVEDLVLETKRSEEGQVGSHKSLKQEILSENGDTIAEIEDDSSQILQDENGELYLPRWTECHCSQCAPLLMPMRKAAENLCVLSPESFRANEGAASSTSLPPVPRNTPKASPLDGSRNKATRSAVIFIHGMFSSATFWFDTDVAFHLSDGVKKRHQILAPDLLGCGRSPRPADSLYTLVDQIEAIEKSVVQRYELESFHLVGHSMGSIVALALAARCPQRVRSISLIAPVYPPCCLREDGELAQIPCDAFFSFLNPLTVKGVRALTVCKYYNISRLIGHLFYAKHTYWVGRIHGLLKGKGVLYPRSFIHDYLANYHDAAWHIAHNSLLAGTHAVIPALQKLRDSGHPILVIHGEIDTTLQFRLAEEMSRTFENVELVGVPERGHVDIVFGRAQENAVLIEKAIRDGDQRWSGS